MNDFEIVGMWVRVIGCRAYVHDPANRNCMCALIGRRVKVSGLHWEYILKYESPAYRIRGHRKIAHRDEVLVLDEQPPSFLQFDKLLQRALAKMAQCGRSLA